MGYLHILNFYKDRDILLFKECYALHKLDGTSAHLNYSAEKGLSFFAGGSKHEEFVKLFDSEYIIGKLQEYGFDKITIYGEAIGGKVQGQSKMYGKNLMFVAFDVKIGDTWLAVPNAESIVKKLGLQFVYYERIPATIEEINRTRDMDSVQAIRNGMGEGHPEEGVVLRPLVELTRSNGTRLICKHKKDSFRETKTPREVSPEQLTILTQANEIAEELVTPTRLRHVTDKLQLEADTSNLSSIIPAMLEDVKRESEGEVVWSKEVERAVGKTTAKIVKEACRANI